MAGRRRNPSELPHAPLELMHPLLLPGAEIPGGEIVGELGGCHSVTLLELLRAVLAWSAHPEHSPALDCAALERTEYALLSRGKDAFASPAGLLAGYMANPEDACPREVAWACVCISDWAAERGAGATALQFAKAAALAWPRHARYAWLVAKMLRTRGDVRLAEAWFRRAHRVATWTDDWEAQAITLAGLGNLSYTSGNYARADARLSRALRVTRRFGFTQLEAETLHDLFVVALMRGNRTRAEQLGAEAVNHYVKARHPRLPALAFDFAILWINAGHFLRALPLLHRLETIFSGSPAKMQIFAAIARAAGACGEASTFEKAWMSASELEGVLEGTPVYAACLVDLGLGAASMKKWEDARRALSKGLAAAERRGEHDLILLAESALDAVCRHERAEVRAMVNRTEDDSSPLVATMLGALHTPVPHNHYRPDESKGIAGGMRAA